MVAVLQDHMDLWSRLFSLLCATLVPLFPIPASGNKGPPLSNITILRGGG